MSFILHYQAEDKKINCNALNLSQFSVNSKQLIDTLILCVMSFDKKYIYQCSFLIVRNICLVQIIVSNNNNIFLSQFCFYFQNRNMKKVFGKKKKEEEAATEKSGSLPPAAGAAGSSASAPPQYGGAALPGNPPPYDGAPPPSYSGGASQPPPSQPDRVPPLIQNMFFLRGVTPFIFDVCNAMKNYNLMDEYIYP